MPKTSRSHHPAAPKPVVLVVDDDAQVRSAVADLLGEAGYTVVSATDGADALRKATAERPAAIVLDLTMPVMDGYQFLEQRAATPALMEVPVIILSATIEAQSGGPMIEILRKPFEPAALLRALALKLGRRR